MDKYIKCFIIICLAGIIAYPSLLLIRVTRLNGSSMYPTILDNELIIYLSIFYPTNLTNKIVAFQYNDTINVCHRVIADNRTHILTKGDNNLIVDGWFSKDKLIGWLIWTYQTRIVMR